MSGSMSTASTVPLAPAARERYGSKYPVPAPTSATVEGDEQKNALCPPIAYWDANEDYMTAFLATMALSSATVAHPALASWNKTTRLNPMSGVAAFKDDPRVVAARERIERFGLLAAMNLQRLLS